VKKLQMCTSPCRSRASVRWSLHGLPVGIDQDRVHAQPSVALGLLQPGLRALLPCGFVA